MSKQYRVSGAYVLGPFSTHPVDGTPVLSGKYRGDLIPPGMPDAWLQHHIDTGLITTDDVDPYTPVPVTGEQGGPAPAPVDDVVTLDRPAPSATVQDWRDYAVQEGADPETVKTVKKSDLIAQYGA